VHVSSWGTRKPAARSASVGRPARARARRRRPAAALLAIGLVAGACSGDDATGPSGPSPTFERARGASLEFEDPVATVADLMPPKSEHDKWVIAGSVFDPKTSTSVATTWVSTDGADWERKDVRPGSSDVSESFADMTRTDDGRVAVGWVGDGDASDAAVWRQGDDGWERLDVGEAMGGDHEQWAFDVTASDAGILVAGGESVWGEVRPRLWFSTDGETFTSVDGGPGGVLDTTGQESIREVAAVDGGFVAVGSRTNENDQDGAVWFSADGKSWEEVEVPSMTGEGRQALLTVANAGGVVVAGGYKAGPGDQGQPVVWRSQDGRNWGGASAPLPIGSDNRTATANLTVRSITVDSEGLLAAGGADWRPQVWRSTDEGTTWALLPNPTEKGLFEDGVALDTAAVVGGTTVAIGLEPTVMRLTSDRWQDATTDAFPDGGVQPFATSVAEHGDVKLLAGGRYTSPRAEKREQYVGQLWSAGDGGWDAVDSAKLADGQVMDITAYAGGFVAVGFEDFGLASQRTAGDQSPDGLLWTSRDGKSWSRIAARGPSIADALIEGFAKDDHSAEELARAIAEEEITQPPESVEPAGGEGTRSLEAVAPLGDGFIAVGVSCCQDPGEPIVVLSRDGKTLEAQDTGLGGPGTQRFRDVCVAPDDRAIAVGISGSDGSYDAAVRLRTPNKGWSAGEATDGSFGGPGSQQIYGCAASKEGFIVVGSDDRSGDSDVRVWTSPDGETWTRVESGLFGGSGDQWANAVAAVPDGGWLIGGTDTAPGDGDVALWRLDGHDISRRDEGEPELSGPGEQSVTSLMVDDSGVTIVGDDYGRVGIWQSDTVDR
jgi:hypothetical protein